MKHLIYTTLCSLALGAAPLPAYTQTHTEEMERLEQEAIKNYDRKYAGREDDKKWSYYNDYSGQHEWGLISTDYALCALGKRQSPVQIAHTKKILLPELEFNYSKSKVTVRNMGYANVILFYDNTQTLKEGKNTYTLKSIEFHSPGEHEVHKEFHALEIQFMHQDADGQRLTVAIFGDMNKPREGIDDFLNVIPEPGKEHILELDPSVFLPAHRGYYAYNGSRTIPPCTENMKWRVLKTSIDVSKAQLMKLSKHTGRNARVVQPIYLREILESADSWKFKP